MRTIALLVCLVGTLSALAQDRITVDELEQRLAAEHRSDKELARRLENIELTQRLSTARLDKLEAALPGAGSRTALLALADLSEVLDLPPEEIPSDPPAAADEQQQMLARAYDASEPTQGQTPNFDATANITRFRNLKYIGADPDDPMCRICMWPNMAKGASPIPLVVLVPLVLSHGTVAVAHRDGRVINVETSQAWAPAEAVKTGIENWDGLATLLANVLLDMRAVQPEWARWEQGPVGRLAVFRFFVDDRHAHFPIRTVMNPESSEASPAIPAIAPKLPSTPRPAQSIGLRSVPRSIPPNTFHGPTLSWSSAPPRLIPSHS